VQTHQGAGCLVIHDQGLLLVKNTAGWTIPGGYAEGTETSSQTAVRETKEEAGIEVIPGAPACAVVSKRFVMHVCAVAGPVAVRPDGIETSDVRFFSESELASLPPTEMRFPDQKPALLHALQAGAAAERQIRTLQRP
jgi:ADP-ribose pyrophosphatase YjhB (NUDIX family)